jgi:hypothetical protein
MPEQLSDLQEALRSHRVYMRPLCLRVDNSMIMPVSRASVNQTLCVCDSSSVVLIIVAIVDDDGKRNNHHTIDFYVL